MYMAVSTKNNDHAVAGKPFSWRPIGMLPVFDKKAVVGHMTADEIRLRRLRLNHECISIIVEKLNAICAQPMALRWADGMVRQSRMFVDFLCLDHAEASVQALCTTKHCISCLCPEAENGDTSKHYGPRLVRKIVSAITQAGLDMLDEDGHPAVTLETIHKFERETKHKLEYNAWLDLMNTEIFLKMPKDELHQWYLGVYGEHIIPSIIHKYKMALRRPDLLKRAQQSGNVGPLVSDADIERVMKRLTKRLEGVTADTSLITMTSKFSSHFYDVYHRQLENSKLTGDRVKVLMLALPSLLRDLITPEVTRPCSEPYYFHIVRLIACM